MLRFLFVLALISTTAACHGCGSDAVDSDGSASSHDSGASEDGGVRD
jgi:hypothetical protein